MSPSLLMTRSIDLSFELSSESLRWILTGQKVALYVWLISNWLLRSSLSKPECHNLILDIGLYPTLSIFLGLAGYIRVSEINLNIEN